jgi:putative peptidoglycan lipid II flippase
MSRGRTLARAGLIVTGAFLLSRILGWLRMAVIVGIFGASGDLDAFLTAFRIPDLVFQLVAAGALGSALIPVLAGLLAQDELARAWRVASSVLSLMMLAFAGLATILAIQAPTVVGWLAPEFDAAQLERTVELTRIMLVGPALLGLGAVATSVLNADGRFAAAALAGAAYNLAIILAALILSPFLGVTALAVGVVAGAGLGLVIQLPPLARMGFRYRPAIDLEDPAARRALTLMGPRAIGMGASQITFMVANALASGLGSGAITVFYSAFTLLQIPIGLIGVPLGTVVFPSMVRDLATGSTAAFVGLVTRSIRLSLFVMLPVTALGIALRADVVTLLLGYGAFTQEAVTMTADALLFFLLGLAAHSAIAVLARAFYAGQDTRTPVAAAILAVVINSTLAIVFAGPFGLPGLALAIAIAAWAEALVLLVILGRRQPALRLGPIGRLGVQAAAAAALAGVVTLGLRTLLAVLDPDPLRVVLLVEAGLAGLAGGLIYLVAARALRIPELASIVEVMLDLFRRRSRA